MGDLLDVFPDAEVVTKALLAGQITVSGHAVKVVTEAPPEFIPPLIEVQRLPGAGANDGFADYPHMQVSVFASTRADAWAIARAAEQLLLAAGRTAVVLPDGTEQLIDSVQSVNSPDQRPYEDPEKRRVVASFRLTLRRPYRRPATP